MNTRHVDKLTVKRPRKFGRLISIPFAADPETRRMVDTISAIYANSLEREDISVTLIVRRALKMLYVRLMELSEDYALIDDRDADKELIELFKVTGR